MELVIVFYLELKVGPMFQNGNNDDNVLLKSFSLSCVYIYKNKTKRTYKQTYKQTRTWQQIWSSLSLLAPLNQQLKNTKESGDKLIFNEVCDKEVVAR
jgi:hypothetical protein